MEQMKLRIKSTIWNTRKKKHSIRTARRKKNPKQNEDRVRSLWDIFKHTNNQIIGVPEGEEKEQEIENLFEKVMKENSPVWCGSLD